jgi:enediyne biosynthesis protein E4
LDAYIFETIVLMNNKNGTFSMRQLPVEAQFSPVYAIAVADFDSDSIPDILLGGNLYEAKPESGIYDGSYGTFLKGNGNGTFRTISAGESGFFLKGAVRDIVVTFMQRELLVIVGRNNDRVALFSRGRRAEADGE